MYLQASKIFSRLLHASKLGNLKYLLLLAAVLGAMPSRTFGQNATVVGTGTDPSGGAVAGVTGTITSASTGAVKTFTTNQSGQYVAPDLAIGHYSGKANGARLKDAEQKG